MTNKKEEKETFNAKEEEMTKTVNIIVLVYVAKISTYRGYTTKVDENDVDNKYIDDK
jgi:3-deoxy-D-arabino-heptulosonate 7-phosphate (DAHP) synthase